MELCTKSDAKNGRQYQEVIVRSKRIKRNGNWFHFNFLLKARVLNLKISKRKHLSLPLKVETDQFVICLVLPECLSVTICCISPSNSEANRDSADAESPFPLFFSFLPHLRTLAQEKGRKSSSFWDWWLESLFY